MSAALTPAQFAEARAYCRGSDGSISLQTACRALGFPIPPSLEARAQLLATGGAVDAGPPLAQASAGPQPSATPVADRIPFAALTRQEQADKTKAYAKQHGVGILAALKVLGFDRPAAAPARTAPAEPPVWARPIARRSELAATAEQRAAVHRVRELQAAAAKAHAAKHKVSFVAALKTLGFAT